MTLFFLGTMLLHIIAWVGLFLYGTILVGAERDSCGGLGAPVWHDIFISNHFIDVHQFVLDGDYGPGWIWHGRGKWFISMYHIYAIRLYIEICFHNKQINDRICQRV